MMNFKKQIIGAVIVFVFSVSTLLSPLMVSAESTGSTEVTTEVLPSIEMTINTSSVDFGSVAPTTASYEKTSAIIATISSNNTFKLEVQASGDFTGLGLNTMTADHLKIKESNSPTYLDMSTSSPVLLLTNQPAIESQAIPIDMKLVTDWLVKPDTYSTTLNFVATQI